MINKITSEEMLLNIIFIQQKNMKNIQGHISNENYQFFIKIKLIYNLNFMN